VLPLKKQYLIVGLAAAIKNVPALKSGVLANKMKCAFGILDKYKNILTSRIRSAVLKNQYCSWQSKNYLRYCASLALLIKL